jgi:4-amino-4-deoxy-L-arabinose transferase-like glycosyltransferase
MGLVLENLTILFPLITALGVLLWFCRWVGLHRNVAPASEALETPRGFGRRDWLCMGILTVVYAVVAFVGLGQNAAPQSFLHYTDGNQYALIELNEPQVISRVRYYCGLGTADYRLEFSVDGETWVEQTTAEGTSGMTQSYNQLFRWNEATLNGDQEPVRYIRIVSGTEQYLGEIALYDGEGELLTASDVTLASGCEMLMDEQDVIPDSYSYKNGTYFDEIYFPRTALEMIQGRWPYEITHPPLGKAILSLGIRLFGMTPFGWRFMGVLFGILMLPVLYVFLKKMFGYTSVAACGSTIFAFDFMHYTQTRLATIDTYAVFFTLLMYLFLYGWLTEPPERKRRRLVYLALSGLSFGLGAASKWVCIYAGAGLGFIWLAYWIDRFVHQKKQALGAFGQNVLWCLLFFVLVPAVVYYLSYYSYGPSQGVDGIGRIFTKTYWNIVIDNQKYMWNYHSDLVATHPYSSVWYQWMLDIRPILYYLEYFDDGTKSAFAAFSNPLVCWGGLCAMGGMVWLAVRDKDKRALFIFLGYIANLLPWVLIKRLTFAYHYFPCTVFLVLALARLFEDLRRKDRDWQLSIGGFTAATVGLFVLFYPVLSGLRVSMDYTTYFLKWFTDTWPF